jgi:uncharacterized repeat protein (TIGR01451 family)
MTIAGIPTTDDTTRTEMRRGAPVAGILPVLLIRPIIAILLLALAVTAVSSPAPRPVAAQAGSDLTLSLTPSTTKAKIGDVVIFRVRVANTGTTTIPDLFVNLGLPDALDARAINCPGDDGDTVTSCTLGDFAPDSVAEVLFVVEVGSREGNGRVAASVSSHSIVLVTDTVPQLKIVGPRHPN